MSHIANKEQEKAFKQAIAALKKCKKVGLVVYAKNSDLVAYTKEADEYADRKCPLHKMDVLQSFGTIPYIDGHRVISDAGADDYAFYVSQADAYKFNPDEI